MAPQGPELALAPSIHVTLYADLFVLLLPNPIIYTNKIMEIHKEIIRIISQNNIWVCP